ncbi:bL33 family ribosomal protein [Streptomyces albospinus]|nr:bL33 family ribosomal protein [Streptomyces albospinus]
MPLSAALANTPDRLTRRRRDPVVGRHIEFREER